MAKKNNRRYVAKDIHSLRTELTQYAKAYFPNSVSDFSEASMGGMLVDLAAMVGDTMTFYLDHQFNELNWQTAVETKNIQRHADAAGVEITGAAGSSVKAQFYIEVPATTLQNGKYAPDEDALPVVLEGTVLRSSAGVEFVLDHDVDFREKNADGTLKDAVVVASEFTASAPAKYLIQKSGFCISGRVTTQQVSFGSSHQPFKKITLTRPDVTEIIGVRDTEGNEYYEVESLTQDTVYKPIVNLNGDEEMVPYNLEPIPAPYRFTKKTSIATRLTTLTFGGGDGSVLEDDILPDPSALSLPLHGTRIMKRFSIDPKSLLQTKTLGIAPKNTSLQITYRSGGGLHHNISADSITSIGNLLIRFSEDAPSSKTGLVRASVSVGNLDAASGGAPPLSVEQIRTQIPVARQAQSRIVTKQDLIARIYSLPAKYGRVFRVGIRPDPNHPLTSRLFIISRNSKRQLVPSPDTLKLNLQKYLNDFRLISDSIDILDAPVVNFRINTHIMCGPTYNKQEVIADVIKNVGAVLDMRFMQIDRPIMEADIVNRIINTRGVIAMPFFEIKGVSGEYDGRNYSSYVYDMFGARRKGMYLPPEGGIFEFKFPTEDISVTAL